MLAPFIRSVLLVGVIGLLASCTGPTLPGGGTADWDEFVSHGPRREVLADWDDLDAAVFATVADVEMAIVSKNKPDPERRVFELRTIRDEPAWLVATRPQDAGPGPADPHEAMMTALSVTTSAPAGSQHLVLRARVGRFGDKDRENALLQTVAARLHRLHGKDWAPLD